MERQRVLGAILLPVLTAAHVPAAIPSAPRNLISSVNETSLSLEWDEPDDTGGRSDLVYNVVCKKCLRDRSPCTRCDDNVDIAPRRLGLRQRKVVVRNLQAHTRYSFEVQAVNGVSGKKSASPSFSTVNITTNQAGEKLRSIPLQLHPAPAPARQRLVRSVTVGERLNEVVASVATAIVNKISR